MSAIFENHPELFWAVSQKQDGNMKLTGDAKTDRKIITNRKNFLEKFKIPYNRTIKTILTHGREIAVVSIWQTRRILEGIDGLITDKKDVFLTITGADCPSVFFYDQENKVIGLAHAGWKGIKQEILSEIVARMMDRFNSQPKNILAAVGPCIGPCHFEVQDDLIKQFEFFRSRIIENREEKFFLDLRKLIFLKLTEELGILEKNIAIGQSCTFCKKDKYFSRRRDGKNHPSMLIVFGIKTAK